MHVKFVLGTGMKNVQQKCWPHPFFSVTPFVLSL